MSDPKPCWDCLKKRLVCDFGRPGCRKCESRNTECSGYDKKPLKWLAPGQTRSKGRRARNESNVIRLCLNDSSETSTCFEAIEYYNVRICPDLVAVGCGGDPNNPFIMPPADVPHLPANIRHTIVSISLAHRILQSEDALQSDRAALSAKLQAHRGSAIRHLAIQLETGPQTGGLTLASVIVFLFAEIQHTLSPSWRYHCDAVYAIIDMLGGMSNVAIYRPLLGPILRYFILLEPERARRQLEMSSLLPTLYGNGLSTTLPCPPDLLSDIISINNLRSKIGEAAPLGNHQGPTALDILKRVGSFSAEKWITTINLDEQCRPGEKSASRQQKGAWDWESVAHIYQSAVALYCISSLFDVDEGSAKRQEDIGDDAGTGMHIAALRSTYRDVILRNLKAIASNPQSRLRKLVFWPLVIGGIHIDANDNNSKDFILGELTWMSKALGTASPLVAKDVLGKIWSSSHGIGCKRWDSLFDRPYVFLRLPATLGSEERANGLADLQQMLVSVPGGH
ncbi:hypothetical protein G7Z17_g6347 [Cylindrodendrum hubeiense]|uniref:Zn(2)-C6 fungal-type domain-containing protein n=1 Tax=Cylindrodendrum hubeiense TaxID=595255 RepID=A0A9P5H7G6_9HYPO|nr:hypothetical protein G7Z17_g6347 [Cylindrodendrum hubeiense]